MINTIIFDFGDVFINLNYDKTIKAFDDLKINLDTEHFKNLNVNFETGKINETQFLEGIQTQNQLVSLEEIKKAWNTILGDFPLYRLEFLQNLKSKYKLFLLSNTDKIHIEHFENKVGESFYSDFYQCFDKVYFSYEMKMRKPDIMIFNEVIYKQNLSPKRTLFVDDKKINIDAAAEAGLQTWHLQVGQEDVVDLFKKIG